MSMFKDLSDRQLLTLTQLLVEQADDDECMPPFEVVAELQTAALRELDTRNLGPADGALYPLVNWMLRAFRAPPTPLTPEQQAEFDAMKDDLLRQFHEAMSGGPDDPQT